MESAREQKREGEQNNRGPSFNEDSATSPRVLGSRGHAYGDVKAKEGST